MHVWNVLHAARWKYRMQKIAICAPSHNFVGLYLRNEGMYRQSEKNLLNSSTSSTCPVNMYPLPSNRHHRSSGDCLEGKRENYQVCSVQYCVQQLYTVRCTHIWTDLTVLWIGFSLTGPISLWVDSFLCMYYFVSDCTCMHVYCVVL